MANQQHNKVPNNAPRGNKPKTAKWLYIVYGVIMLVLLFGMFGSGSETKKPVDWNKLSLILERHDYESITVINQEVAEIRIKADAIKAYPDLYKDLHTQTITGTEGPAGYYTYNIGNYEHFDKELARSSKAVLRVVPQPANTSAIKSRPTPTPCANCWCGLVRCCCCCCSSGV